MAAALPESSPSPRTLRWWLARPGALAAVLAFLVGSLAVLWYLASPLFIRTRLDEAARTGGIALARGAFSDRDAIHRGSGTATLLREPDGRTLLQLSDFRVTNGPDLYIYLSTAASPDTHDDVTRGLQVGRLKASEGNFTYELPAGTSPAAYHAAVIYCLQFRTIFSVAPLSPA